MLSDKEKTQLSDIEKIIDDREKKKENYYVYDNNIIPLYSSVKFQLSKKYYLKDIDIFLYGKIVKNFIVISWGMSDTIKIINDFTYSLEHNEK
jgi:hypothetical protein